MRRVRCSSTAQPWSRAAPLAAFMLLTSACGAANVAAERVPPTAVPTALPAPQAQESGLVLTLEVINNGTVELITDHRGHAVYGNTRDRPDELFCVDECTANWEPLIEQDPLISPLLDPGLYSLMERPDGTSQVVYNSTPLYTWSGDDRVGVAGGVGVAGLWFALTVDGQRLN